MADDASTKITSQVAEQRANRIQLLYWCSIALSVILFLAVVWLSLDGYFYRPVREMAELPGVKLWTNFHKEPRLRHEVVAIEFQETVVTTDRLPAPEDFPNLYDMEFTSCRIQPAVFESLSSFPGLMHIRFYSCKMTGDSVGLLSNCPHLSYLSFVDCDVDVGQLVSRCAVSESLEWLSLKGISIAPGDFSELQNWKRLKFLRLERSDVDAEAIRDISKAPSIENIDLSETDITDDEIAAIVETDVFRVVTLDKTNVTGSQISELCRCRNLEFLNFSETDVPAAAIESLARSKSLKRASAYHTPLGFGFNEKHLENGCIVHGSGVKQGPRQP